MRVDLRVRAVLLVLAALLPLAYLPAQPAGAQQRTIPAKATAITVHDGSVRIVLEVANLDAADRLQEGAVRVTVDGQTWPATAELVAGSSEQAVPRSAMLVVDNSGSMGAQGIAAAQAAAGQFLDVVAPDVAVGLVTFAAEARVVLAPTRDRDAARRGLATMQASGNTRLFDGIDLALGALGSVGERALIVLSDGKDTASTVTQEQISAALAGAGASVDLVAFRTEEGQRDVLQRLAVGAGGRLTEAGNAAQLGAAFSTAGRALDQKVVVVAEIPPTADGLTSLSVQLPFGAVDAVAEVPVPLPELPGRLAGEGTVPTAAGWPRPVVLAAAFLTIFTVLLLLLRAPATWRGTPSLQRSRDVERYAAHHGGARSDGTAAPGTVTRAALGWADRTVTKHGLTETWQLRLERAGMPLRPNEWLIMQLGSSLALAALAVLMLPWWLITGSLGALVGWLLSGMFLSVKAGRRAKRFADQLPDVLQLIAGSLRTGFSLPQAVDNAAKDGAEPIAAEFSRALAESRLGVQLEDALERVATRMGSDDLDWTVMAIRIAREVGGNLAEVLLSTAETMRERGRIQRQVRTLSAEGRLSAYVLIGLPVGLTLWMVLFRGDYVGVLVTDPIGWAMTFYGVLSVLVGAWWMSRLIKLEV